MNAHVPQSLQTAEELRQLCAVSSQIISPRECKPIISIVQDIASGVYRMSKNHVRVSEKQLFNLMCPNPKLTQTVFPEPGEVNGKIKKWTGKQLLSTILPEKVNIYKRTDAYKSDESEEANRKSNTIIEVRNGQVISGLFSKDVYQDQSSGIVHQVFNEYGPDETRFLFDNTQQLVCNWLVLDGFSVGISDMVLPAASTKAFQKIIHDMKVSVYTTIADIHRGKFENKSIKRNCEYFEDTVNNKLNSAVTDIGKKGRSEINENTNRLINMIKSRSKGNDINVAQMMGCVGQQNVDGKRIPYGFDDRTLPHYTKYDDGPESRGFIESSFISGLSPQEFYFAAMGGREGLIDTAVNTSETGYIQRKLVKAMEDCKVNYDMTVRNASGNIIQFLYGEDGADPTKIESQHLPYISMNILDIVHQYGITDKAEEFKFILEKDILKSISKDKSFAKRMTSHVEQLLQDREHIILKIFNGQQENRVYYPVAFQRILLIASNMQAKHAQPAVLDIDPRYILDEIDKLCELVVTKHQAGNKLFQMLVRLNLSPKNIILKYKLCKSMFDYVVQQIKYRFYESLAHPSEMVGVIAAQSLGEPATQLTLNTFHLAGVSAASKAVRGVPRLNELLGVTRKIKAPIMKIYLQPEIGTDKKRAVQVMNEVRTIRFKDIIKASRIYFDPDDFNTNIPEDKTFIDLYREFSVTNIPTTPWLLRLEFDRAKMLDYGLDMISLHHILDNFYDERISVVFSDDNSDQLIMRVKLTEENMRDVDRDDLLTDLKALEHNILENVVIRGIKNIERASIAENKSKLYNVTTRCFEERSECVLYTDGTNLKDIFSMDIVDASRTITNDVVEIYEVLGVEAARQMLYNEIVDVLDNIHVNYRHIALLVDVMTNKGTISSVNRHGINRGDIGPLAKCSFEETTDKLIKAGIFAEYDKINGVAANVMLGQIPPAGTGDVRIMIDETKLNNKVFLEKIEEDEEEDEARQFACSEEKLNIQLDMPMTKTAMGVRKMFNQPILVS